MIENEQELGRIDAVAGDGDHGRGMVKGSTAAYKAGIKAMSESAGAGSILFWPEKILQQKQVELQESFGSSP